MNVVVISPVQSAKPLTDVWGWGLPVLQDGLSPHDRSRSYLISRALSDHKEADAFLWIDDDTEATAEQAEMLTARMVETDADLVTGVYVCRHAAERGALALNFNIRFLQNQRGVDLNFYQTGGPSRINACGFGFVLTHRRMFERCDMPYARYQAKDGGVYEGKAYFLPLVLDGEHLGEDRSFCARNPDATMLVDTRVCVGHAGHTVRGMVERLSGHENTSGGFGVELGVAT